MTEEEKAKRFCKFELCTHRNGEGMCCLFNQDNCIFHRLEKENEQLRNNGFTVSAMTEQQLKVAIEKGEQLERENEQLKTQIEKMKCCGNCSHRHYWGNELGCNFDLDKQFECDNNNKKYWEFKKE